MATPREAFDRLRSMAETDELAAFCEPRGIHLLVVFGSVAVPDRSGDPRDLDIAVLADEQRGPWGIGALISDLAELLRLDAVDVMDLSTAGPLPRSEALTRCVPLYEDRPGLFAEQQMAAVTERMETRWMRSLDLDLLAR